MRRLLSRTAVLHLVRQADCSCWLFFGAPRSISTRAVLEARVVMLEESGMLRSTNCGSATPLVRSIEVFDEETASTFSDGFLALLTSRTLFGCQCDAIRATAMEAVAHASIQRAHRELSYRLALASKICDLLGLGSCKFRSHFLKKPLSFNVIHSILSGLGEGRNRLKNVKGCAQQQQQQQQQQKSLCLDFASALSKRQALEVCASFYCLSRLAEVQLSSSVFLVAFREYLAERENATTCQAVLSSEEAAPLLDDWRLVGRCAMGLRSCYDWRDDSALWASVTQSAWTLWQRGMMPPSAMLAICAYCNVHPPSFMRLAPCALQAAQRKDEVSASSMSYFCSSRLDYPATRLFYPLVASWLEQRLPILITDAPRCIISVLTFLGRCIAHVPEIESLLEALAQILDRTTVSVRGVLLSRFSLLASRQQCIAKYRMRIENDAWYALSQTTSVNVLLEVALGAGNACRALQSTNPALARALCDVVLSTPRWTRHHPSSISRFFFGIAGLTGNSLEGSVRDQYAKYLASGQIPLRTAHAAVQCFGEHLVEYPELLTHLCSRFRAPFHPKMPVTDRVLVLAKMIRTLANGRVFPLSLQQRLVEEVKSSSESFMPMLISVIRAILAASGSCEALVRFVCDAAIEQPEAFALVSDAQWGKLVSSLCCLNIEHDTTWTAVLDLCRASFHRTLQLRAYDPTCEMRSAARVLTAVLVSNRYREVDSVCEILAELVLRHPEAISYKVVGEVAFCLRRTPRAAPAAWDKLRYHLLHSGVLCGAKAYFYTAHVYLETHPRARYSAELRCACVDRAEKLHERLGAHTLSHILMTMSYLRTYDRELILRQCSKLDPEYRRFGGLALLACNAVLLFRGRMNMSQEPWLKKVVTLAGECMFQHKSGVTSLWHYAAAMAWTGCEDSQKWHAIELAAESVDYKQVSPRVTLSFAAMLWLNGVFPKAVYVAVSAMLKEGPPVNRKQLEFVARGLSHARSTNKHLPLANYLALIPAGQKELPLWDRIVSLWYEKLTEKRPAKGNDFATFHFSIAYSLALASHHKSEEFFAIGVRTFSSERLPLMAVLAATKAALLLSSSVRESCVKFLRGAKVAPFHRGAFVRSIKQRELLTSCTLIGVGFRPNDPFVRMMTPLSEEVRSTSTLDPTRTPLDLDTIVHDYMSEGDASAVGDGDDVGAVEETSASDRDDKEEEEEDDNVATLIDTYSDK